MNMNKNTNTNIKKNYSIEKSGPKLKIHLKEPHETLLKSILTMGSGSGSLNGVSLVDSFLMIQFYGNSMISLKELLSSRKNKRLDYATTTRLIDCLYKQQQYLCEHGYSFYSFNVEDIMVVDEWTFFFINSAFIKELRPGLELDLDLALNNKRDKDTQHVLFHIPFTKNSFCSPEIMDLKSVPSYVSLKTIYYSLASLAYFCFFGMFLELNMNMDMDMDMNMDMNMDLNLESIAHTKLYWFFKRALIKDVDRRRFLFI